MNTKRTLQDQVLWYLNRESKPPFTGHLSADVVIVGGGMAGLSAAQAFAAKGKKVVLIEKSFCGGGASGKSSGFITPNSELSFTDFIQRFGVDAAKGLWDFIADGLTHIKNNIEAHDVSCEYIKQDSLVLATSKGALKTLAQECENLSRNGYKSAHYDQKQLAQIIPAKGYYGAMQYFDSFGINAYQYCQYMKDVLTGKGVTIYEETPALSIEPHTVKTAHGTLQADHIIVCVDSFMSELGLLEKEVFHAQTFLMASAVLTDQQVKALFPADSYMSWDTDMVYTYFRLTATKRLLLGGGDIFTTLALKPLHNHEPMRVKLMSYFKQAFPDVAIDFEYFWPGMIGLSKDVAPIAGRDKHDPSRYYIAAAAGLPIAAALGIYSCQHLIEGRTDLDAYLTPYRTFPLGGALQTIIGNQATFGLSNLLERI